MRFNYSWSVDIFKLTTSLEQLKIENLSCFLACLRIVRQTKNIDNIHPSSNY